MRQRLGIAAAMLADPPVLMFDEPFNGIDPEGIVWMRGFLRSLAAEGRAVLVSSHLMSELQDTADHLVSSAAAGCWPTRASPSCWPPASGDRVMLRTAAPAPPRRAPLLGARRATVPSPARTRSTMSGLTAEAGRGAAGAEARSHSRRCPPTARRLEQAYMELTRDAVEYRRRIPPGKAAR